MDDISNPGGGGNWFTGNEQPQQPNFQGNQQQMMNCGAQSVMNTTQGPQMLQSGGQSGVYQLQDYQQNQQYQQTNLPLDYTQQQQQAQYQQQQNNQQPEQAQEIHQQYHKQRQQDRFVYTNQEQDNEQQTQQLQTEQDQNQQEQLHSKQEQHQQQQQYLQRNQQFNYTQPQQHQQIQYQQHQNNQKREQGQKMQQQCYQQNQQRHFVYTNQEEQNNERQTQQQQQQSIETYQQTLQQLIYTNQEQYQQQQSYQQHQQAEPQTSPPLSQIVGGSYNQTGGERPQQHDNRQQQFGVTQQHNDPIQVEGTQQQSPIMQLGENMIFSTGYGQEDRPRFSGIIDLLEATEREDRDYQSEDQARHEQQQEQRQEKHLTRNNIQSHHEMYDKSDDDTTQQSGSTSKVVDEALEQQNMIEEMFRTPPEGAVSEERKLLDQFNSLTCQLPSELDQQQENNSDVNRDFGEEELVRQMFATPVETDRNPAPLTRMPDITLPPHIYQEQRRRLTQPQPMTRANLQQHNQYMDNPSELVRLLTAARVQRDTTEPSNEVEAAPASQENMQTQQDEPEDYSQVHTPEPDQGDSELEDDDQHDDQPYHDQQRLTPDNIQVPDQGIGANGEGNNQLQAQTSSQQNTYQEQQQGSQLHQPLQQDNQGQQNSPQQGQLSEQQHETFSVSPTNQGQQPDQNQQQYQGQHQQFQGQRGWSFQFPISSQGGQQLQTQQQQQQSQLKLQDQQDGSLSLVPSMMNQGQQNHLQSQRHYQAQHQQQQSQGGAFPATPTNNQGKYQQQAQQPQHLREYQGKSLESTLRDIQRRNRQMADHHRNHVAPQPTSAQQQQQAPWKGSGVGTGQRLLWQQGNGIYDFPSGLSRATKRPRGRPSLGFRLQPPTPRRRKMSKKTSYNAKWGVKSISAFLMGQGKPEDPVHLSVDELVYLLPMYYKQVRRGDGGLYSFNSLINIRAMINGYLKSCHPDGVDIVVDSHFLRANEVFDEQLRQVSNIKKPFTDEGISHQHMRLILTTGVFHCRRRDHLVRKAWYDLTRFFLPQTDIPQENWTSNMLRVFYDRSCHKFYVTWRFPYISGLEARMYETKEHGCPVGCLTFYLSKLSPQSDKIFQEYSLVTEPNGPWFGPGPLDKKEIDRMMTSISEMAGLPVKYENASVCKTRFNALTYFIPGIPISAGVDGCCREYSFNDVYYYRAQHPDQIPPTATPTNIISNVFQPEIQPVFQYALQNVPPVHPEYIVADPS